LKFFSSGLISSLNQEDEQCRRSNPPLREEQDAIFIKGNQILLLKLQTK
jgi:hypothetical protein